jgi:hypothetical protein
MLIPAAGAAPGFDAVSGGMITVAFRSAPQPGLDYRPAAHGSFVRRTSKMSRRPVFPRKT